MKKKKSGIGGFFKEFGEAVVKGDLFVKLSLVWMGSRIYPQKTNYQRYFNDSARSGSHCIHLWLCHKSMYVILELWERFSRRRFSIL